MKLLRKPWVKPAVGLYMLTICPLSAIAVWYGDLAVAAFIAVFPLWFIASSAMWFRLVERIEQ